jgi:hypothetical protein
LFAVGEADLCVCVVLFCYGGFLGAYVAVLPRGYAGTIVQRGRADRRARRGHGHHRPLDERGARAE